MVQSVLQAVPESNVGTSAKNQCRGSVECAKGEAMKIKPVLSSKELLDKYEHGIKLYALPATHRIVPVELLERILQENYLRPSESEACIELVAIIDKEPT